MKMLLVSKVGTLQWRETFWPVGLGDYLKMTNWINMEIMNLKLYQIPVCGTFRPWGKRRDLKDVGEREKLWRLADNLKGENYS